MRLILNTSKIRTPGNKLNKAVAGSLDHAGIVYVGSCTRLFLYAPDTK